MNHSGSHSLIMAGSDLIRAQIDCRTEASIKSLIGLVVYRLCHVALTTVIILQALSVVDSDKRLETANSILTQLAVNKQ